MSDISLYIHIPFCASKCLYCDFLSFSGREGYISSYMASLIREIESFKTDSEVNSIFIGGGTPSLLDGKYIEDIMKCIYSSFSLKSNAEITVEANPGTVDIEKLSLYKAAGINRISFGAQTTNSSLLGAIGRIHGRQDIFDSISAAKKAGFENINCDLMFSLPHQSTEDFLISLEEITALEIPHISAYSLIVEEGTPLYDMYASGRLTLPDEDEDRRMYHSAVKLLADRGYRHYEISNFAKDGYECRHNLVYWRRGEYKGFGLGAASLLNGSRLKNTEDMEAYTAGKTVVEEEKLTLKDIREEFMFLGLRCTDGISEKDFFSQFKVPIDDVYGKNIAALVRDGLILRNNGRIYLTPKGLDLANMVFLEFIDG